MSQLSHEISQAARISRDHVAGVAHITLDSLRARFRKTRSILESTDLRVQAFEEARELVYKDELKIRQAVDAQKTLLHAVVRSKLFEIALFCVIMANLVIIVYETNLEANCYPRYIDDINNCPHAAKNNDFISLSNVVFVAIYGVEALLKIFVERTSYFKSKQNICDFVICLCSLFDLVIDDFQDLAWIRSFRAMRILRIFDVIVTFPELRMLCVGFAGSMRAIFFGSGFILVILILSGILLVQFVHPINSEINYEWCERCGRSFASVQSSVLTLYQQIVTGDSWGFVSIPIIEKSPYLGMSLCVIQLIVGVGAMNLILAVIVDTAAQARDARKDDVLKKKVHGEAERKLSLLHNISQLDADHSGTVTKGEILSCLREGSTYSHQIQEHLILADVTEDDLMMAFDFLEKTSGGEISYLQLCDVLDEFQSADIRKLSVLNKMHLNKLEKRFRRHERYLERIDSKLDNITIALKNDLRGIGGSSGGHAPDVPHLSGDILEKRLLEISSDRKVKPRSLVCADSLGQHLAVDKSSQQLNSVKSTEHLREATTPLFAAEQTALDIESSKLSQCIDFFGNGDARTGSCYEDLHNCVESLFIVLRGLEEEAFAMRMGDTLTDFGFHDSGPVKAVKRALAPLSEEDLESEMDKADTAKHVLNHLARIRQDYEIKLRKQLEHVKHTLRSRII